MSGYCALWCFFGQGRFCPARRGNRSFVADPGVDLEQHDPHIPPGEHVGPVALDPLEHLLPITLATGLAASRRGAEVRGHRLVGPKR